jgi:hypothetical protein
MLFALLFVDVVIDGDGDGSRLRTSSPGRSIGYVI